MPSKQTKQVKTQPVRQPRHVPQRTCIGCGQTNTRRGLVRLVRLPEQRVGIDHTGKQNGRGAYLCHAPACWQAALKRRKVERALRIPQLHPDDRVDLERFSQHLEETMVD